MSLRAWFERNFPPMPAHPAVLDANFAVERGLEEISRARFEREKRMRQRAAFRPIFMPTRDEFDAWRDDPTTAFAFAALRAVAEECKRQWSEASWETGKADPADLIELKSRADAYLSMEEASYEAFCEWLGFEPEPVERDVA